MKVLVTGGSGFIGSHVVDMLLSEGHEVLIYDLEKPHFGQRCKNIEADVNDTEKLKNSSKGFDAIYHMAAEANVNRFFQNPVISNMNTANSTISVLECARENNIGRILLSSTEWVYGSLAGSDETQITEETPVASNPDHLYTSSKIAAELYCKNYMTLYGINYTIMRYGIPFGERARPETVTPIFIDKILSGGEITIHGSGSQTRQFIYVKDLAEGNVFCLKPEAENQIFNINGREVISVLDIVKTLEKILNKKAKIKFIEDRKGNYKGRFISSEKAEKLLGWKPKNTYFEAMERYVKNFKLQ
ncbi:MAG TPA: NAD-dependent epimerase/dehydratase family protein [Ignavibacteria bacterium]|nr:NAD-dependent epimerase/dehydratase family protein [Ignavibacteria bacterium]